MSDETAVLAEEIRRLLTEYNDAVGEVDIQPLAPKLAADLIATGWRPPASRAMTAAERAEFDDLPTDDPAAMQALGYRRLNDIPPHFVNNWMAPESTDVVQRFSGGSVPALQPEVNE